MPASSAQVRPDRRQIAYGSDEYGWQIGRSAMATMWRGGCIMCAAFLDEFGPPTTPTPKLPTVLICPAFAAALGEAQVARRHVVATAALLACRPAALSPGLARPFRCPTHLPSGQRRRHLPHAVV
jgi:6-phosphogluconate dehydrogenase